MKTIALVPCSRQKQHIEKNSGSERPLHRAIVQESHGLCRIHESGCHIHSFGKIPSSGANRGAAILRHVSFEAESRLSARMGKRDAQVDAGKGHRPSERPHCVSDRQRILYQPCRTYQALQHRWRRPSYWEKTARI